MIAAVIAAAGSGTRFGDLIPKQLHRLPNGKTIIQQTTEIFLSHKSIDLVCVVTNSYIRSSNRLIQVYGGETRHESVCSGLEHISDLLPSKVLIHDGARPFVSHDLISSVISMLDEYEAVDVALPITDTIKTYDGTVIPRDAIYATQTPQGFHFNLIFDLHQQFKGCDWYTDDISMYLAANGRRLGIVKGSPDNIKITYKRDLVHR